MKYHFYWVSYVYVFKNGNSGVGGAEVPIAPKKISNYSVVLQIAETIRERGFSKEEDVKSVVIQSWIYLRSENMKKNCSRL